LTVSTTLGSDLVGTDISPVPVPRGLSPQLWAALQKVLADRISDAPARVLDCGGGSGSLAVPLAACGAEVTVVDVSIDALGTLTRRAAEAGVSDLVTGVQGEAELLTSLLPAEDFDLVLAHEVLDKTTSMPFVMAEAAAMLVPGGTVSIVVANPVAGVLGRALSGDVAGALLAIQRTDHEDISSVALERACVQAGLDVISVEGLGVFSDIVPGIDLERPGAMSALAELEATSSGRSPYRDIASRLHLLARKPNAFES
jgi:SAM-dependent methyltransferase